MRPNGAQAGIAICLRYAAGLRTPHCGGRIFFIGWVSVGPAIRGAPGAKCQKKKKKEAARTSGENERAAVERARTVIFSQINSSQVFFFCFLPKEEGVDQVPRQKSTPKGSYQGSFFFFSRTCRTHPHTLDSPTATSCCKKRAPLQSLVCVLALCGFLVVADGPELLCGLP